MELSYRKKGAVLVIGYVVMLVSLATIAHVVVFGVKDTVNSLAGLFEILMAILVFVGIAMAIMLSLVLVVGLPLTILENREEIWNLIASKLSRRQVINEKENS